MTVFPSRRGTAGDAFPGLQAFDGLQPVETSLVQDTLSTSTTITGASSRIPLVPLADMSVLRFAFGNWYQNVVSSAVIEVDGANAISVSCSLERDDGSVLRLWRQKQLMPGESALTPAIDPLFTLGVTSLWLRVMFETTAGQFYPNGKLPSGSSITTTTAGTPTDTTATTGALGTTTGSPLQGPRPFAVLGQYRERLDKIVIGVNDSIGVGYYDPSTTFWNQGFLRRVSEAAGYPILRMSRGSNRLVDWVTAKNFQRSKALIAGATHAVVQAAVNDLRTGRTVSQLQADHVTTCNDLRARGVSKIIAVTCGPDTASGDATQVQADEIPTFNTWLRAGQSHFDALWDPAIVWDPTNANAWGDLAYQQDDLHPSTAGHQAATAAILTANPNPFG